MVRVSELVLFLVDDASSDFDFVLFLVFNWMVSSFFSPIMQSVMVSKMSSILEMIAPGEFRSVELNVERSEGLEAAF